MPQLYDRIVEVLRVRRDGVATRSGILRRRRLHESSVAKAIRAAVLRRDIRKRVTAPAFRHSIATHLSEAGSDVYTVPELPGHSDVRTTMIDPLVLNRGGYGVRSPADFDDLHSE